jgi:O-antigen/teichoic acid export membrane protein
MSAAQSHLDQPSADQPSANQTPQTPAEQLEPEPLTSRAVRSFAWSALSFGGNRLVVFVSTVVLARILTPHDFGAVAAATAVILYFDVVLDLGIGAALIYEQEHGTTDRVQTAFTLNLLITVTLTGLGMLATPAIAAFFGLQAQQNVFRALFGYLFIRGLGQVQNSMLQRDLRFGRRATLEIARGVARAGVSIGLALAGFGVWALVVGLIAGEVTGTVLSWALVGFWPRFSLDRRVVRALMGFGLAFIALKVVDAIAIDSDYLVVGNRLGATQLGFYSMGYRLPEIALMSLYWMFGAVAFPIYAQARLKGRDVSVMAMLRALRLITLFSFPAGVLLALLSRDVIYVVFSAKWAPAITPMALISLMTAIMSVGFSSGDLFPALGRPGTLLVLNAPLTLLLVIAYILVAPLGIIAIAAAHVVMSLLAQGARLVLVSRMFDAPLSQQLRSMRPGACAVLGVLALAGPVRLLLPHGAPALAAILLAGVGGALVGVYLGSRSSMLELRTLAASMRPSASA